MNFDLSEEQVWLQGAAREALSRHATVQSARGVLDGAAVDDDALWRSAVDAGWPGIMVSEAAGGAGLGPLETMLVLLECGRVLAPIPLAGHTVATVALEAAAGPGGLLEPLVVGARRATVVSACPPSASTTRWTVGAVGARTSGAPPRVSVAGEQATVNGTVPWVRGALGADIAIVVGLVDDDIPIAVAVELQEDGVSLVPEDVYDGSCLLARVAFDDARGIALPLGPPELADLWYLELGLLSAEAVGSTEAALEMALAYAKERMAFGRRIGSYQAIKHVIVEMLRLLENARSLMYYAGWAFDSAAAERPLASSAFRVAATHALDFAARENITVHGGIGATWEHDAHLYFRRAQQSRRLLAGVDDAAKRVGEATLRNAGAPLRAIAEEVLSV